MEELLAAFLRYGSCLASAAIALGLLLALIDLHFGTRNLAILPSMGIATMGIVLFILLPTMTPAVCATRDMRDIHGPPLVAPLRATLKTLNSRSRGHGTLMDQPALEP
jgi:hypothetical protein